MCYDCTYRLKEVAYMEDKKKQILEIFPSFNLVVLSDLELERIKPENDLVKGFHCNRRKYTELKQKIKPIDEVTFFDVCHLLGVFTRSGADLEFVMHTIEYLYTRYTQQEIFEFISGINDIKYSEKLANVIICAILSNTLKGNYQFFAYCCNNFKSFSKDIEKINKNRMKMITIRGSKIPGDEEKLKQLRIVGKSIMLDDVIDYISKVELLNNSPELAEISKTLLLETYDRNELQDIISFYQYSLQFASQDEEYFKNFSFLLPNGETIEWLSAVDPLNLVLGYLLKVCSTFSGTGSKIMIDGILDPRNKHIVFKDANGSIIGKTTCICHDNYLFCNSLNFIPEVLDKLTREQERDYYYYYMIAVNAQLQSLKERGFDIREVRIANDEYAIVNCIRGRSNASEFKELLSKASYFWEEFDEKLFDHNPPQYILQKNKTSI